MSHTLGPWVLATSCSWRRIVTVVESRPVLTPVIDRSDNHPNLEVSEADAALMVASPEMLAALQAFIALDPNFSKPIEHVRSIVADGGKSKPLADVVLLAREAIAKATGGAA